jgi:hypothetical protein
MDEFALKWYQAKRSLFGQAQVSTFVRFSTAVDEEAGMEASESAIVAFIRSAAPLVERALSGQRDKRSG